MKDIIARVRDKACAWMLRLDPDYLGLYRTLDTVLHLPPVVLATLASKASDRRSAVAEHVDRLTAPEGAPVGSGGTSTDRGMHRAMHITDEQKVDWLLGKFSEEDRRGSVWVKPTIFGLGGEAGVHTGFIDPADVRSIIAKTVRHYEQFPG